MVWNRENPAPPVTLRPQSPRAGKAATGANSFIYSQIQSKTKNCSQPSSIHMKTIENHLKKTFNKVIENVCFALFYYILLAQKAFRKLLTC